MAENIGKITQIVGAVLDIRFSTGVLPEIHDAIEVKTNDSKKLVLEVAQHLGDDTVRCIAMGPTDGLVTRHGSSCYRSAYYQFRSESQHLDVCLMY